jgi:hypothetical protein
MMKRIWLGLAVTMAGAVIAAEPAGKTALPLREVILYTSGVGYFERASEIEGAATTELRFRTEDINDLLKSLVVQDLGGGQVGVITYDSRDPISKTLGSFAVNLTTNPSMRDLLNQMRGEKVQVLWPNETRGVIIGVEQREVEVKEGETKREEDFVNVFSGGTLKSIPLSQIKEIKLENANIQKEMEEALSVLAKGHDTEKKTVTLAFGEGGKRKVSVSYIAEAPVWKTSYRLVLPEDGAEGGKNAFLQGWAIIENTGDDDWENVQLSLVSGRPISFKMDLYQPLYATRPVVQPELYLSLRPPVHQDNLAREERMMEREALGRQRSTSGIGGGALPGSPAAAFRPNSVELGKSLRGLADTDFAVDSLGIQTGTAAVAEGAISGELFQYALKTPVSIQRQKSAMLPIVTEKVEGTKVSIYNQNVQSKHPLNAFRLKNSTALHLMQGPLTIFDGGSYAGDARIEDLAPGQDRLVSYAIDLKTEVEPQAKSEPDTLVSARIRHGTFFATKKSVEEKKYVIRNKDQKKKTVLIEHPVRGDWTLETPKEPTERARDVYRFKTELEPGKSETLAVREGRHYREEAFVTTMEAPSYAFYLRSNKVSDAVKDVLRKVVAFRDEIAQLAADRKLRDDRLAEISQEQTRIRENMARLTQNSELYQRYVKKFDEQETEFERLRGESAKLKEREAARQREFNEYLSKLELE